jgi:toxin secretion/phage lysis holin
MSKIITDITVAVNFKTISGLIGSTIAYLTGGEYLAFGVLLILTAIDGITGVYKAWVAGEINSLRFRDKIVHYIAYCFVIISMNQVLLITPSLMFLADFVVLYFATGELISIMENLEEAGIPMPTVVKTKLMEISKRKEQHNRKIIRKAK